ncbi:MAG: CARDB domain-containing protein [Candidatus Aenigmatarchaeota archaeon]
MRKKDFKVVKFAALLSASILLLAIIPASGYHRAEEVEESTVKGVDEGAHEDFEGVEDRYTIESLFDRDELGDDHPYDMDTIKDMGLEDLNWTNQDIDGDGKADWNHSYEDPETGENKTLRIIEGTFGGEDMLGGGEYTMYDKEDIKEGDLSDPRTINTRNGAILVLPHNYSTAEGDGNGIFLHTHGIPSLQDPLYRSIASSVVNAFDAPVMLVGENETNWEAFNYSSQDMITFVSLLPLFMQDVENISSEQLKMFYPYQLLRTNLLGHTLFERLAAEFGLSLDQGIFSEGASKQGYVRWFAAMLDDRIEVAQCDWFHLQDMVNATKRYYRDWGRPPIEDHDSWAYYSNEIATLMTSVSDSLTTLLADDTGGVIYDVWDIHRQAELLKDGPHISITGTLGVGEYDGGEWETEHDGTYFPIGAESNFLNRLKQLDIDYRYGMDKAEPLSGNAYPMDETRMFNNWFNSMDLLFEEAVSNWSKVADVEATIGEHNETHDQLNVTATIENTQENMTVRLGYAGNSDRRWNDPEHDMEEGEYPWMHVEMNETGENMYEGTALIEKDVMYGYYVEAYSPGVMMYLSDNPWHTNKYDSSPLKLVHEYEYEVEGVSDMFVEDHSLAPEEPSPGEEITMNASAVVDRPDINFGDEYYDAHAPLRNIDVEFLVDQELMETRTITISEFEELDFSWTPEEVGTYQVAIEVDANDVLPEFDEGNNVYGFEVEVAEEEEAFLEVGITSPQDGEEFSMGDSVPVQYTVQNTGDMESTQQVEFTVDGAVEDNVEITLSGGEEHQGEFTWDAQEPGEHVLAVASEDDDDQVEVLVEELEPAFFEVESMSCDEDVKVGEDVVVNYTVTNTGEMEAAQDIRFTVHDDEEEVHHEVERNVTVSPGESFDEGGFTWQPEDPGNYTLTVASEDDEEEVEVTVLEGPRFEVEIVNYDEEVTEGEDVVVEYRVTNTGDMTGERTVVFYVDGSPVEEDQQITLGPRESYEGEFTWTTEEEGDIQFEVSIEEDGTAESSSEATVSVAADETTEDPSDVTEEGPASYWWIVLLVLILAGLIAALLFFKKKGEEEIGEDEGSS